MAMDIALGVSETNHVEQDTDDAKMSASKTSASRRNERTLATSSSSSGPSTDPSSSMFLSFPYVSCPTPQRDVSSAKNDSDLLSFLGVKNIAATEGTVDRCMDTEMLDANENMTGTEIQSQRQDIGSALGQQYAISMSTGRRITKKAAKERKRKRKKAIEEKAKTEKMERSVKRIKIKNVKKSTICRLPPEIITMILDHLSVTDRISFSNTCTYLRQWATQHHSWKQVVERKYPFAYRKLYSEESPNTFFAIGHKLSTQYCVICDAYDPATVTYYTEYGAHLCQNVTENHFRGEINQSDALKLFTISKSCLQEVLWFRFEKKVQWLRCIHIFHYSVADVARLSALSTLGTLQYNKARFNYWPGRGRNAPPRPAPPTWTRRKAKMLRRGMKIFKIVFVHYDCVKLYMRLLDWLDYGNVTPEFFTSLKRPKIQVSVSSAHVRVLGEYIVGFCGMDKVEKQVLSPLRKTIFARFEKMCSSVNCKFGEDFRFGVQKVLSLTVIPSQPSHVLYNEAMSSYLPQGLDQYMTESSNLNEMSQTIEDSLTALEDAAAHAIASAHQGEVIDQSHMHDRNVYAPNRITVHGPFPHHSAPMETISDSQDMQGGDDDAHVEKDNSSLDNVSLDDYKVMQLTRLHRKAVREHRAQERMALLHRAVLRILDLSCVSAVVYNSVISACKHLINSFFEVTEARIHHEVTTHLNRTVLLYESHRRDCVRHALIRLYECKRGSVFAGTDEEFSAIFPVEAQLLAIEEVKHLITCGHGADETLRPNLGELVVAERVMQLMPLAVQPQLLTILTFPGCHLSIEEITAEFIGKNPLIEEFCYFTYFRGGYDPHQEWERIAPSIVTLLK